MGFRRKTQEAPKQETKASAASKPAQKSKASGGKTYHNDVFDILEGQDGSMYLKLNEFKTKDLEITINGKTVTGFFSKDPMVALEESVEAGRLSEERAQEIADKIPEFVKARVTVVTE